MSLGDVLRTLRQRVGPADVGLPAGPGERRTPGLRREELATLAGVSPDYVKRLEQGRSHPSSDVVRALARALRATREEHELLAHLAGHASPPGGTVPRRITPGVQRMADRLGDVPLGIFDATWTLLSGNRMWSALFGDTGTGRERNVVWRFFTGAETPVRHTDAARTARSFTADLHDAVLRYPADQELAAMVRALRETSDRFAELWEQPTVAGHGGQRKRIVNAIVGELVLDCDVLTVHDADLNLVVFTATPNTPDAEKLAVLSVVGLQDMTADPR